MKQTKKHNAQTISKHSARHAIIRIGKKGQPLYIRLWREYGDESGKPCYDWDISEPSLLALCAVVAVPLATIITYLVF